MSHQPVGLGWDDDILYESRLQEAHEKAKPVQIKKILKGNEALEGAASLISSALQEQQKLQGRREFQSLPISIENRVGSIRRGEKPDGTEWATKMTYPYGYIRGTEGVDGDHLDCFVGPNEEAKNAYVIHTKKAPKFREYDEDKVMLGFDSEEEAKEAFFENYDDERFYGGMDTIPMRKFIQKAEKTKEEPQKLVASLREAIRRHVEFGVKGQKWGVRKRKDDPVGSKYKVSSRLDPGEGIRTFDLEDAEGNPLMMVKVYDYEGMEEEFGDEVVVDNVVKFPRMGGLAPISAVRALLRGIKKEFPRATKIGGLRISGIRKGKSQGEQLTTVPFRASAVLEALEYGVKGMRWGERKEEPETAAGMLRRQSGEWQSAMKKRAEREKELVKEELASKAASKGLHRPNPKTEEEQRAADIIEDNGMVFGGTTDLGEGKLFVYMHDLTTRSTAGEFSHKITPESVSSKRKEMHKKFQVGEARGKFQASVREARLYLEEYGVKGMKWGVRRAAEKVPKSVGGKWNPDADLAYHWTDREGIEGILDRGSWEGGSATTNPAYRFSKGVQGTTKWALVMDKGEGGFQSRKDNPTVPWKEWEVLHDEPVDLFPSDPFSKGGKFLGFGVRNKASAKQLRAMMEEVFDDPNMFPIKFVSSKAKTKESDLQEAKRPRLYYARSLDMFESDREDEELELLEEMFPDHKIVFPSKKLHRKKGMPHFHEAVDKADLVVISPRKKDRLTAGVASEAVHALHEKIPVKVLKGGRLRNVRRVEGGKFVLKRKK